MESNLNSEQRRISNLSMPLASYGVTTEMSKVLQDSFSLNESQDFNDVLDVESNIEQKSTENSITTTTPAIVENIEVKTNVAKVKDTKIQDENKESCENEDETKVEGDDHLFKLVSDKQKGISDLLSPLTSSMDPEMSKILQDSLNEFVINESQDDQINIMENDDESKPETNESIIEGTASSFENSIENVIENPDDTVDSSLVDLALEKQTGISSLLSPIITSLNPEMAKLVQDSLNDYVINESNEARAKETKANDTEENRITVQQQAENLAKEAENLTEKEQQEVLELISNIKSETEKDSQIEQIDRQTSEIEVEVEKVHPAQEDTIADIHIENQALVGNILQPLQQFIPPELLETMSQAIINEANEPKTSDERKKSINIEHSNDMVTNIHIDEDEQLKNEQNVVSIESQSMQSSTTKVSIRYVNYSNFWSQKH